MLFQLGQEHFDVPLDVSPSRAWLTGLLWRIQPSVQFDQPTMLTFEAAILSSKSAAALDHGQELIQNGMAPFLRLRANRQRIDYIFATTDVLHECRWEPTTDM